ncbi:hypothetical protein LXA43DRAFT_837953, partial [Ganoderma leucocontextum]
GLASGEHDNDARAAREFVKRNVPLMVCQVRHKTLLRANARLYGGRVGALHILSPSKEGAVRMTIQLSVLARSEVRNSPA